MIRNFWKGTVTLTGVMLGLMACGAPDATSPLPRMVDMRAAADHIPFEPEPEKLEVCKTYLPGATGPDVTFDYTFDDYADGTIDRTGSVVLAAGTCADIAVGGTASHEHQVVVTERVPMGFAPTYVIKEYHMGAVIQTGPFVGETAAGYMHGDRGFTIIFLNRGTYGCSHGYWKQPQHAMDYPAGYAPTTLFSAVFEGAFPGKTLDDVLSLQGGGLNALGREAVAALLNAGRGFYWYSPAEVIGMFNAVYPGTKDEYNMLKARFEMRNLAGCPLS